MYVQVKLQFQAILDQVFPQYAGVFGDLFAESSLRVLQAYPTPKDILEAGTDQLIDVIKTTTPRSRSLLWSSEKAKKIMTAAQACPILGNAYESHVMSLQILITFNCMCK
jgi:transposase